MVMPLHDDAPMKYVRWPIANWTLIAINVVIYLLVQSELFGDPLTVMRGFALIPAVLFGEARLADWVVSPPAPFTLITSLFFHSGFWHLAGNMLFLYVFGDNVEDAMGPFFYLLFYLCCGVMGGFFFALAAPDTVTPLVGASAAISGVCAAFLLLFPKSTIFGLVAGIIPVHAPAYLFVGTWIALQFFNAVAFDHGHVAWWAHVGGIAAGLMITPLFKRRKVRIFGPKPQKGPWEA
jgi:membrane associated rhomboid family serine protease